MNKKHLNIVLIFLLIIIWSSVFYKYFGENKSSIKNTETISTVTNYKQKYNIAKDTFQLSLIDRDPFGISSRAIKTTIAIKTVNKPKVIEKPISKNIVWPSITYHGFVKGENETTRLILLKIDKRLFRKREKETVNDITLVKAYNDSLIVSLNNDKKTIKKQ